MSSGDDYQTLWLPNSHMRERATVPATTVDALSAVKGFMQKRYAEQMPDGRYVAELAAADVQRVADGYGCGNAQCLAFFDRRFQSCPVCGEPMGAANIVEYAPAHWQPSEGRTSKEILESR